MFRPYTIYHLAPLVTLVILGIFWIRWSRKSNPLVYTWWPALIIPGLIVYDVTSGIITDTLNLHEDLPLHLCRITAFLLIPMFWFRSRKLFGVLYFWILAGTLQAIITPDLEETFPDYQYFRYWILHAGLIVSIMYPIFVWRITPTFNDMIRAFWYTQVYLLGTLIINYWLGSNYGYTCSKPDIGSIADVLGPWPWYILTGQGVMVLLFGIVYLPVLLSSKRD